MLVNHVKQINYTDSNNRGSNVRNKENKKKYTALSLHWIGGI